MNQKIYIGKHSFTPKNNETIDSNYFGSNKSLQRQKREETYTCTTSV